MQKRLSSVPILMQESFWWWQCSTGYRSASSLTSWNLGPQQYLFMDTPVFNKFNQTLTKPNLFEADDLQSLLTGRSSSRISQSWRLLLLRWPCKSWSWLFGSERWVGTLSESCSKVVCILLQFCVSNCNWSFYAELCVCTHSVSFSKVAFCFRSL